MDDLALARTGEAGWALAARVQEPRIPSDVPSAAKALGDPDPVVRGLGALALRDRGAAALPALDALTGRLDDGEAAVRMMSANAIASIGPAAAAAVGPLSAACRREGEVTHVLRACAEALGRIGRPASSALPLLRDLTKKPLVRWSAQRAIDQIEGR